MKIKVKLTLFVGLLFAMIPPPSPVPSVIITTSFFPFAAPPNNSPKAATLASLLTKILEKRYDPFLDKYSAELGSTVRAYILESMDSDTLVRIISPNIAKL